MSELVTFERSLEPMAPHFDQVLAGIMPVARLIRTAIVSAERSPFLLECNRQSFFSTIMSSAVLGLEMDGVTGQAFPVPFKGKVQLIIGYKGYNTLGARAGITITGEVVRQEDEFDYLLGSNAFIKHRPKLGGAGRIIAAWALASSDGRPPIPVVMGIDELLELKAKSPGAKRSESPWNDNGVGYAAMCSKCPKRRLARSTPLTVVAQQFHLAASMETQHEEMGNHAFIQSDRTLAIVKPDPMPASEPTPQPTAGKLLEGKIATGPIEGAALDDLTQSLRLAAKGGDRNLRRVWGALSPAEQVAAKPFAAELKEIAAASDAKVQG